MPADVGNGAGQKPQESLSESPAVEEIQGSMGEDSALWSSKYYSWLPPERIDPDIRDSVEQAFRIVDQSIREKPEVRTELLQKLLRGELDDMADMRPQVSGIPPSSPPSPSSDQAPAVTDLASDQELLRQFSEAVSMINQFREELFPRIERLERQAGSLTMGTIAGRVKQAMESLKSEFPMLDGAKLAQHMEARATRDPGYRDWFPDNIEEAVENAAWAVYGREMVEAVRQEEAKKWEEKLKAAQGIHLEPGRTAPPKPIVEGPPPKNYSEADRRFLEGMRAVRGY